MTTTRHAVVLISVMLSACGPTIVWQGRSLDRAHRARVLVDGERQRVELDGVRHASHDGIGVEGVRITSADGQARIAYPARDGDEWRVVLDGEPGPAFAGVSEVTFDTSGRRLAYFANDDAGWWVVVDDERHGPWPELFGGTLTFSADGRRVAWVVTNAADQSQVVLDGTPGPGFDGVGRLTFAPDGRATYLGRRDETARLVIDQDEGAAFDRITELHVGRRIAYVAEHRHGDDPGWHVVIDGDLGAPLPPVSNLRFTEDEEHHAFTVRRGAQGVVFFDGRQQRAHDELGPIQVRASGPVYGARDADVWRLFTPEPFRPVLAVERIVTRDDRWGAVVRDERGHAVVLDEGTRVGTEAVVADLVLAGDSTLYLTERGGVSFVVADGEAYPMRAVVRGSLVATEDGRHWACVALEEDQDTLRVVLDGVESVPFEVTELASALSGTELLELTTRARESMREIVQAELRRWVGR